MFTVRQSLLLAFAALVLFITGALLTASLLGTARLASQLAEPLVEAATRDAELQLTRLFDPIRERIAADLATIRMGNLDAGDPVGLKNAFLPGLVPLSEVGSMMLGDVTGRQFLVMRYDQAAYRSALMEPVAAGLPPPVEGTPQFFTREVRPEEWGERSEWTLWDPSGRKVVKQWSMPLPGYDPRERPWHRLALANFKVDSPQDAQAGRLAQPAWTDVYTLFTTQSPGISATVAGRDPEGVVRIVAYDLLLDEIARFTATAPRAPVSQIFVFTQDGRLLGPPVAPDGGGSETAPVAVLDPIEKIRFRPVVDALRAWRGEHLGASVRFRFPTQGGAWWAGFKRFTIDGERSLWIGVLLRENDVVPWGGRTRTLIVLTAGVAMLLSALYAIRMARRLSTPLAELADQSRRIAALDLAETPTVKSRLRELATLGGALHDMRTALRSHIAERDRARLEATEREQEIRTLAENITDVVIRFDRDLRVRFANRAFHDVTGLDSSAVQLKRLSDLPFQKEYEQSWLPNLGDVLATGRAKRFDAEFPTPDGRRTFETQFIPEVDAAGAVASILSVSRDITERIQAGRELRHSEERYRSLINSTFVGICVQVDGVVRFCNPSAAHLLGFQTPDDVRQDSRWLDFVDPAFRDEIEARAKRALGGEPLIPHPGWRLLRRDGTHCWVQSSAARIDWDGANALMTFLLDVTELRRATERQAGLEEQLRHAQKLEAVGLLAAGIAHDFNNLLQVMAANAALAMDTKSTEDERRLQLREIRETVDRASAMTRQLVAFSRQQPLSRKIVDVRDLISRLSGLLRRMIPENIRLTVTQPEAPLLANVDSGQIEQVLLNLCVNARDAMPSGGELTIRIEAAADSRAAGSDSLSSGPADYVRLSVADTGTGIAAGILKRIFEPFFTTKLREHGSGLGLSVAYGIVEQHNGRIDVESTPGKGSKFTVLLPRVQEAMEDRKPSEPKEIEPHKGTILIAEDDEQVRRLARLILTRNGHTVVEARDGNEAVAHFKQDPARFDLLFLDVMMPGISGFEVLQQCRAICADVPALIASGYAAESLMEGATIPDDVAMIPKPYDLEDLLAAVATAMKPRDAGGA